MILCHFSEVFQPFLSKHLACNIFGHANALDCLNFVQGLHSFMVSKCRKWHLRGTYLKIIRRGVCHRIPLGARTFSACGCEYTFQKPSFVSRQGWNLPCVTDYWMIDQCDLPKILLIQVKS